MPLGQPVQMWCHIYRLSLGQPYRCEVTSIGWTIITLVLIICLWIYSMSPNVGPVYLFAPRVSAFAQAAHQLWPMSGLFLLDVNGQNYFHRALWSLLFYIKSCCMLLAGWRFISIGDPSKSHWVIFYYKKRCWKRLSLRNSKCSKWTTSLSPNNWSSLTLSLSLGCIYLVGKSGNAFCSKFFQNSIPRISYFSSFWKKFWTNVLIFFKNGQFPVYFSSLNAVDS